MKYIYTYLLFCVCLKLSAQNLTQTLRGNVTEEGNVRVLRGVNVKVQGTNFGSVTDTNGVFVIANLPLGRYAIEVSGVGYQTLVLSEVLVEAGKQKIVEIGLKPKTVQLSEAIVRASPPPAFGSVQTITQEQTLRYAATFFDAARLVTSFPGVVAANDQANGLVIRGNSPNGMQWRMEGVEIVNPNHLSNAGTFSDRPTQTGGGTTIFSAQLLDRADFLMGAFPAEYGNALSGVMDVHLRKGNNQKHEFTAQAGLIGLDFAAEGPLSRKNGSSYLVNYRYSFTGLLAAMGVKFGGEAIRFQDLSFNLVFPTKKGRFTVFGMGGSSSNIFEAERDASKWKFDKDGQDIEYKSGMAAVGTTSKISLSDKTTLTSVASFSFKINNRADYLINSSTYSKQLLSDDKAYNDIVAIVSKVSHKISQKSVLNAGAYITGFYDNMSSIKDNNAADKIIARASGFIFQPFASFQTLVSDKITIQAGVHYLNYTYNKTSSLEPRVALAFQAAASSKFTLAYGLHSQVQLPQTYLYIPTDIDCVFGCFNSNLGLTKSHQFVVGYEKTLKNNTKLKIETYYSSLFNVPINGNYSTLNMTEGNSLNAGTLLQNAGTGQNYGIEATYEKYLTKNYYLILGGSLYKSTFVAADGIERPTRFDGGHTFSFTGGKELIRKNDKRLGLNTKVLWLGGYRDTPYRGLIKDFSRINTIQLADYFRTDLRIYWKRNKPGYTRTWSLDVQNLTNTENEAYSYYDFRANQVIMKTQLGLIPVLNYKVEF